ncbi:MAG TPA: response regulator, partial [Thermoanaerobaculia bacterium]|nr:response regulator [Thermoanaerobaculia bacterium]
MSTPVVSSPVNLKGRRILLVDDEESIRFGVGTVLERHGARVATAASAAQALVAAREEMPDLVLLDMRLPDGDGVDVLNRILAE